MATNDTTAKPAKSKTDQAIDYMNENNTTAYTAAQKFGITPGAIYKRIKLLSATAGQRCRCCGQLVK